MLFGLCVALCAGCAVLGLAFLLGAVRAVSPALSVFVGLLCFLCSGFAFHSLRRNRKTWQLDISGTGQIRLSDVAIAMPDAGKPPSEGGLLVRLLADSTMWPNFLLLRLRDGEGRVHHLASLPDSLPSEAFRAVSVACRWIAAHRFSE